MPPQNTHAVSHELYRYKTYVSGLTYIIATRTIVVVGCPYSDCIVKTGDVADTFPVTPLQIQASGSHTDDKSISTFVSLAVLISLVITSMAQL